MKTLLLVCFSLAGVNVASAAKLSDLSNSEGFPGHVRPEKSFPVTAGKTAVIREVRVAGGEAVKAGEVLVRAGAEVIKAERAGVVAKLLVKEGDRVVAGQALVEMTHTERMVVRALAPERERAALRLGDPVRVEIRDVGSRRGEIVFLHPKSEAAIGMFWVWARVDNADGKLKNAQVANVHME